MFSFKSSNCDIFKNCIDTCILSVTTTNFSNPVLNYVINSIFRFQSKRKRLPSSHSDKSDVSNTMKSPLSSPKNEMQETSIKDSNSSSLRKRRSRTPEPLKKSRPRIHQEGNFTFSGACYNGLIISNLCIATTCT